MLHASTQQLIRKLCELTEAGAIPWKEGERDKLQFETEGYIIEIEEEPVGVRLLRQDGRELERANAADLAVPWPDGEGTYATHIAQMAKRGHRVARGAELAISKILSSLSAPPQRELEPEPEPAAPEFAASPQMQYLISAAESPAALAALDADLELQRRAPVEDPPVSHSLPDPTPEAPAEADTAIERVLAVQHAVIIEPEPEPQTRVEAEPEPQTPAEPVVIAAIEQEPEPEPVAPPPEPEPVVEAAPAMVEAVVEPAIIEIIEAPATPGPAPRSGFGSIDSFARTTPKPADPAPAKMSSVGLLFKGISARTHQTVEQATTPNVFQPPAPTLAPIEKQLEPAAASGADIYKPWS